MEAVSVLPSIEEPRPAGTVNELLRTVWSSSAASALHSRSLWGYVRVRAYVCLSFCCSFGEGGGFSIGREMWDALK